jgi:hypothetical protein
MQNNPPPPAKARSAAPPLAVPPPPARAAEAASARPERRGTSRARPGTPVPEADRAGSVGVGSRVVVEERVHVRAGAAGRSTPAKGTGPLAAAARRRKPGRSLTVVAAAAAAATPFRGTARVPPPMATPAAERDSGRKPGSPSAVAAVAAPRARDTARTPRRGAILEAARNSVGTLAARTGLMIRPVPVDSGRHVADNGLSGHVVAGNSRRGLSFPVLEQAAWMGTCRILCRRLASCSPRHPNNSPDGCCG